MGSSVNTPGRCFCGDPIDVGTGNVYEAFTDYAAAGRDALSFTRYYNSLAATSTAFPAGSVVFALGNNWRSNFDRYISVTKTNGVPSAVSAQRADGQEVTFTLSGATWVSDGDVDIKLAQSGTSWVLTDRGDVTETYRSANASGIYQLASIAARDGYTQTLTYDANYSLVSVSDSYSRTLTFANAAGLLQSMTAPDGLVVSYSFAASGANGAKLDRLTKVSYSTAPATSVQYLYENTALPFALTALVDELGNRFSSWTYDSAGRGLTSQHANGADLTTVSYATQGTTVTNALGQQLLFPLAAGQGGLKVTATQQQASSSVAAATSSSTYDNNGYVASQTDMNGNTTAYVNDSRGQPTQITEAVGTSSPRVTTTAWHATLHLPTQIVEPNRTTTFTYDGTGNLLTRTVTAGSQSRTWTYTYNSLGLVLSAKDPRGNTTTFSYDTKGNRTSATNPLGQVTSFTSYDPSGRPLTIRDPNGLVTTLTYDARGRITSSTAGAEKTVFAYDAAGNLTTLTAPDGSSLTYTYDAAHRLVAIKDSLKNAVAYTLDAAGNRTQTQSLDPSNAIKLTQSMVYDSLSRLIQKVGAQGQTFSYGYDANGNATAVTDALSQNRSSSFDALNRLARSVDANGGAIAYAYDANNHLTSVTDPRALVTTYTVDGLDNQIAVASPDTGSRARTFDAAGNVLTSTDARGVTSTFTYDALNRPTATSFSDTTPKVAFKYDEGAYGVGHLTTMIDGTGTTTWTYDQHGRVTQKTQAMGLITLATSMTYDASGRLATVTYPSGRVISLTRDAKGQVSSIAAGATMLASNVVYTPWGAPASWVAASQRTYSRTFDTDGRIAAIGYGATNIAYSFDANSRITGIAETGLAAKTFGYDALGRITSYTSGATSQAFSYDLSGNRTSYTAGAAAATYGVAAGSNQLSALGGAKTATFTYDASGNTIVDAEASGAVYYGYDARGGRVKTVTPTFTTFNAFNGLGERVIRDGYGAVTQRGAVFVYDGAHHLLGEYDLSGHVIQETVWLGDLPIATISQSSVYAIYPDQIGAPHVIADQSGQTVWTWDHDPFGNGLPTGSFTYNLRFPGQYYDAETGLHYNFARDYNPVTGQYLQSDPIGLLGGISTYAYVGGNPVSLLDLLGLCSGTQYWAPAPQQYWAPAPEQYWAPAPEQYWAPSPEKPTPTIGEATKPYWKGDEEGVEEELGPISDVILGVAFGPAELLEHFVSPGAAIYGTMFEFVKSAINPEFPTSKVGVAGTAVGLLMEESAHAPPAPGTDGNYGVNVSNGAITSNGGRPSGFGPY